MGVISDLNCIVDVLKDFLRELNQNIWLGINNESYFDIRDLLSQVYNLSIVMIFIFKNNIDSIIGTKILGIFNEEIFNIFSNAITNSFEDSKKPIPYNDYLNLFSSTLGIMFLENTNNRLNAIILKWTNELIQISRQEKDKIDSNPLGLYENKIKLNNIFSHIKLHGLWYFIMLKNNLILENIKSLLIGSRDIYDTSTSSKSLYGDYYLYPQSTYIPGSELYWSLEMTDPRIVKSRYISESSKKLFELQKIKDFENFLNKNLSN